MGVGEPLPPCACRRRDSRHDQVLADGEVAEDAPVLGHERHPCTHEARRIVAGDVGVVEMDPAAGRLEQAGDRVEQRRLARPVGTDDRHQLAGADVQRDIAHGHDRAVAGRQVLDAQQGGYGPGMKLGRKASVNAGLPFSTVRITTSRSGTPLLPA